MDDAGSTPPEGMSGAPLRERALEVLRRLHARTGDRIAIAAYLGGSDKFDQAVAEFGETYADQNERDHAALADAVASGRVQAQVGV